MHWMLMPLRRYADFQGRSRRKEFWLWQLFNFIIWVPITLILTLTMVSAMGSLAVRAGNGEFDDYADRYGLTGGTLSYGGEVYAVPPEILFGTIFSAAALPLILVGLYSLAVFIPNLAVTIRRLHDQDKSGWFIFLGLIPLVGGLILLVFYFLEGTRGPNRFGPDPKGGHNPPYR